MLDSWLIDGCGGAGFTYGLVIGGGGERLTHGLVMEVEVRDCGTHGLVMAAEMWDSLMAW